MNLSWVNNADELTTFQIQYCIESGKGRNKSCPYPGEGGSGGTEETQAGVTSWSDQSAPFGTRYRVRAVRDGEFSAWSVSNKI